MNKFSDLGIKAPDNIFNGDKVKLSKILNKEVIVIKYKLEKSKYDSNYQHCLYMQIENSGEKQVVFTGSKVLISQIKQIPVDKFPFVTTIIKSGEHFEFS